MKKSEMAITLDAQNDILKANEVRIDALLKENQRLRDLIREFGTEGTRLTEKVDRLEKMIVVDDGR